jgi:CRP-like cAMP-binding protein
MYWRRQAVGLTADPSFELSLTQTELADTLGMTPEHANRVLQQLRRKGLIETRKGAVLLRDFDRL